MSSILVTGGGGFVGSALLRLGDRLNLPIARLAHSQARALRDAGAPSTWNYDGTVESISATLQAVRPSCVVHLATHYSHSHTSADLDQQLDANLAFGSRLLEAMSADGPKRVVLLGTAWQEGSAASSVPVNLYAATKKAFEIIARYYADANGFTIQQLLLFDTYGPQDRRRKVLTLLCDAAKTGERIKLTPGEQLLDLVHVDDVATGILTAVDRTKTVLPGSFETWTLNSDRRLSLRDLAREVERQSGKPIHADWGAIAYRAREVMLPWERGRRLPEWYPSTPLAQGLKEMLAG